MQGDPGEFCAQTGGATGAQVGSSDGDAQTYPFPIGHQNVAGGMPGMADGHNGKAAPNNG